jgi:hypothetical protein
MPDGHATWLTAAACTMAPARATRFNDLPPEHRKDIVRLGFLSAVAVAYTLAMCILGQPIRSRSLDAEVPLPHAVMSRSGLMEALTAPAPVVAPRTTIALRGTGRATNEAERLVPQPETVRRGNVFSRFFKAIRRCVSPRPVDRSLAG